MKREEFSDWLEDYQKRCWSNVTAHVEKHECDEVWYQDLRPYDLADCIEANKQLRGDDCPKFDSVSAAVAVKAFQIKRARFADEAKANPHKEGKPQTKRANVQPNVQADDHEGNVSAQNKSTYVDGMRAYRCSDCRDTGNVSVISEKTIGVALYEMNREPKPQAFGISYATVACHCRIGEVKRMDFARSKFKEQSKVDEFYNKLPAFGDKDFHVHADVTLDAMVCGECRQAKTLSDWDLIKGEGDDHKRDALKCKKCDHIYNRFDDLFEPRYMTLILHLHEVVRNIKPKNQNSVLSDYTQDAQESGR